MNPLQVAQTTDEQRKEQIKILEDIYKKLSAPFPQEALKADKSRGSLVLTSITAQYIVERLNNVLGFTNWRLEGEYEKTDNGILFQGKLVLFLGHLAKTPEGASMYHYVPAIGYSDNKRNVGDTYKSARTDALSKAASTLGVGNDVFKGLVPPPGEKKTEAPKLEVVKEETKVKPASFQGKVASKSSDF
jgi:hypothetical protein